MQPGKRKQPALIAQLSRLISRTMPDDDPGTCVGEDADKVAAYVFEAFYSKAAQLRNKPPTSSFPGSPSASTGTP